MEIDLKTRNFISAIDYLKKHKIINQDKDLIEIMDWDKSNLSSTLSGKKNLPSNKVNKFLDSYPFDNFYVDRFSPENDYKNRAGVDFNENSLMNKVLANEIEQISSNKNMSQQLLMKLITSNDRLIISNEKLVDSNRELVDNTTRLTRMAEINSNALLEISRAVDTKIANFLGSLAEVLVDAPYGSKQEALMRLNKVLADAVST